MTEIVHVAAYDTLADWEVGYATAHINKPLWHGGGANTTSERRIGIAMNYCAGYIRQQENQQLGLAPSLVKTFEPRLQQLVGYGIYTGLIGHIDKHDPRKLLLEDDAAPAGMVWDAG